MLRGTTVWGHEQDGGCLYVRREASENQPCDMWPWAPGLQGGDV